MVNIKCFCKQNSRLRIYSKPERNQSKLSVCSRVPSACSPVGPNCKNPLNIILKNSMPATVWQILKMKCMQQNENHANRLKIACKNSWNDYNKWTYFRRISTFWNHCGPGIGKETALFFLLSILQLQPSKTALLDAYYTEK